ncbi:MAG: class I mannose-6-phosphate isomerase [Sandaracinaceae bacterium]|nr:class I mannose-6-phosphate isomerase [Sandaracinaceae bacterium]
MEHQEIDAPVLMELARFTPPTRTPWGGHRIRALKGLPPGDVVGESWELSIEPDFPSRLDDGRALADHFGDTALLVKLLDAAAPLSVQIHPADDDPSLAPGEGGKPETWYVIAREPGAGIHLGLAEGADEAAMRACLAEGGDLSRRLAFVPVEPGDFFVIEAGTPHAIGAGVFLVEPQRVTPGKRGLTYRYWDWNRTYDAQGRADPRGAPRALHVERALAVTRWDAPRGAALLARVRVRAGAPDLDGPARWTELASAPPVGVARLAGTGAHALAPAATLRALTVLEGDVRVGALRVGPGRTAAIPPGWRGDAHLRRAHGIVSSA